MKLKTLSKTTRDWKRELGNQLRDEGGGGAMAVLAWEILGGLVLLVGGYLIVTMMPELVRYLKIKRM